MLIRTCSLVRKPRQTHPSSAGLPTNDGQREDFGRRWLYIFRQVMKIVSKAPRTRLYLTRVHLAERGGGWGAVALSAAAAAAELG